MFALRKIIDHREYNYVLGVEYQIIERFVEPEVFCVAFKHCFGYNHVSDKDSKSDNYTQNCYAFILTPDFEHIPLYMKQKNFIMTESGKTFDNLTYKLITNDNNK